MFILMDSEFKEVIIADLLFDQANQTSMVVLREQDGNRWFPIHIGPYEAHNLHYVIKGEAYPRPLTIDTMAHILLAAGAKILAVKVNDLRDNTYFAVIEIMTLDGETVQVDSRPSDALPLGLKLGIPLQVAETILEKASRNDAINHISKAQRIRELETQLQKAIQEEEYEQAARLRDQITELKSSSGDV